MYDVYHESRARLPTAVYDLAIRLGAKPADRPSTIRLKQTGRMKSDLASDAWRAFTAKQTISTNSCAFDWRAKTGPLGLVSVRDALVDGQVRLDVMAVSVFPIAHAEHTPALARGELMRYLAEIAWAPQAILCNHDLRWRVDDPTTISVSAGVGETVSEVLLSLDSDGRIVSAFAPDRPRLVAETSLPTPWRGQFSDFRIQGDLWIPFAGEVAWEIDGKPMLYWQGQITEWTAQALS